MKDLQESTQTAIEYVVLFFLIIIIFAGSYKLYKKWITPETTKNHSVNLKIGNKIIEKPSKELCSYITKQCKAKYNMD